MTDAPARQPHPQRYLEETGLDCKNCGNAIGCKDTIEGTRWDSCGLHPGFCITSDMKNFIRVCGCATHTNPPAPEPDHKAPICENCGLDNTTCRMDMAGCLQAQNTAAKAEREQAWKIVHGVLEKLCIPLSAEERGILREADVQIAESLRAQQEQR